MTQPVDLVWATVVAGPDPIPTEWQTYVGKQIGLPQDVYLSMSTDPASPNKFRGISGYRRANPTTGDLEVVLTPPLSVQAQTFIHNLPAPQTWPNGEEAKLLQVAKTLVFDYNVPPAVARTVIQQVYDSTRTLPPA